MSSTAATWDQDLNTWTTTDTAGTTYYWRTLPGTSATPQWQWMPQISGAQEDPPSEDAGTDDADPETDSDTTEGESSDEEKQFTQDDLNKVVAKEVDKAKRGKLDPKELGFTSRKELEDFVKAQKERSEEEKSEAEKEREAAIQQAKEEATKGVMEQSKRLVLKSEFKLMAQEHGVSAEAREDAFVIAQTLPDWEHVEVSDEGDVSGLDADFFEELKKSKPYLFAQPAEEGEDEDRGFGLTPDIGARAGGGKGNSKTAEEAKLKAKYPALQGAKDIRWRW